MLKNILTYSLIITSVAACANNPIRSYKDDSDKMLQSLNTSNIESTAYGNPKNPDILFYMEYGTALRMMSNYDSSDLQLGKAQSIVDVWTNSWSNTTGGEIANTAIQMLVNDSDTDYEPKGYEKTMLATYRALNHIDNKSNKNQSTY